MNGNGILTWFDCNSFFRNLRIILSDLRFLNTFQFVKYGASAYFFFFTAFGTKRSQRAFTRKLFIIFSCYIKARQLQLAVFHLQKKLKTIFRKRHLNVFKNVLFRKIDFERDIPAKI